jgi:hypothetical protein
LDGKGKIRGKNLTLNSRSVTRNEMPESAAPRARADKEEDQWQVPDSLESEGIKNKFALPSMLPIKRM